MIPIRCFSCNKVIANKIETYEVKIKEGMSANEALDYLQLERYCCRRMLITYVPLVDKLLQYDPDNLKINNIKIS